MINCLSQQKLSSQLSFCLFISLFLFSPILALANDDSDELREEIRNAVVRQLSQQEGNEATASTDQVLEESEDKERVDAKEQEADVSNNKDTTDTNETTVVSAHNIEQPSSPETSSTMTTEEEKASAAVEKKPITPKTHSRKTRNTLTQEERYTADYIMRSARSNTRPKQSGTSGWIYLGAYKQQERTWENKMLNVNNTLPRVGSTYALKHALNMRETYPMKDSTSKLLKSLKKDTGVKILNVHLSGKKGHYWALVQPIQTPRGRSR